MAAEATFAFSGLPSWEGEAGLGWGRGRDRGALPPLVLGWVAAAGAGGGVQGEHLRVGPWKPQHRTTAGNRPRFTDGETETASGSLALLAFAPATPAAPVKTEAPEGVGRVGRLDLAGGFFGWANPPC